MAISFNPSVATSDESNAVNAASVGSITDTNRRIAAQPHTPSDTTALSSSSDSVASLTQAALATGASRADRVAALQGAVATNQYAIDPQKIADALVKSTF